MASTSTLPKITNTEELILWCANILHESGSVLETIQSLEKSLSEKKKELEKVSEDVFHTLENAQKTLKEQSAQLALFTTGDMQGVEKKTVLLEELITLVQRAKTESEFINDTVDTLEKAVLGSRDDVLRETVFAFIEFVKTHSTTITVKKLTEKML